MQWVTDMTSIARYQAGDSDELADALSGWSQDYTQLGRGQLHSELLHIALPEVALIYERSNLHLHQVMAPPADEIVFGLVLKPERESLFNGQPLLANHLLVLPGGQEMSLCPKGGLSMLGLSIKHSLLTRLTTPDELALILRASRQRAVTVSAQVLAPLRDSLVCALRQLEMSSQALNSQAHERVLPVLLPLLQALEQGTGHQLDARPVCEQRQRLVNECIELMHAHLEEPLSMIELCQTLNTSLRTLQYSFQHSCGATPLQYFLSLRLTEARRRLKRYPQRGITELALDLNFSSSSHFSTLYKRLFAQCPSQQVRQPITARPVSAVAPSMVPIGLPALRPSA